MTAEKTKAKTAACPTCGGDVEVYKGDNTHKRGTAWCPKDGRIGL